MDAAGAGGEDGKGTLTLRSLVSTKEAGIIIGGLVTML
jgi:hypothetical protein